MLQRLFYIWLLVLTGFISPKDLQAQQFLNGSFEDSLPRMVYNRTYVSNWPLDSINLYLNHGYAFDMVGITPYARVFDTSTVDTSKSDIDGIVVYEIRFTNGVALELDQPLQVGRWYQFNLKVATGHKIMMNGKFSTHVMRLGTMNGAAEWQQHLVDTFLPDWYCVNPSPSNKCTFRDVQVIFQASAPATHIAAAIFDSATYMRIDHFRLRALELDSFRLNHSGTAQLCPGSELLLHPGYRNYDTVLSYRWQDGSRDSSYRAVAPGWHWLEVQTRYALLRDSVWISYQQAPLGFSLGPDRPLERGKPMHLSSGVHCDSCTYQWSNGSTTGALMVNQSGHYWLDLSYGSCSFRDSVYLYGPMNPPPPEQELCPGEETLELYPDPYCSSCSYSWNTGWDAYRYRADSSGVYVVTTTFPGGYSWTDSFRVKPYCEKRDWYIANSFTPNGDGLNERFGPVGWDIQAYELWIYNIWGQQIYHSGEAWTGADFPQGVYHYHIQGRDLYGRPHYYNGTLHLLR